MSSPLNPTFAVQIFDGVPSDAAKTMEPVELTQALQRVRSSRRRRVQGEKSDSLSKARYDNNGNGADERHSRASSGGDAGDGDGGKGGLEPLGRGRCVDLRGFGAGSGTGNGEGPPCGGASCSGEGKYFLECFVGSRRVGICDRDLDLVLCGMCLQVVFLWRVATERGHGRRDHGIDDSKHRGAE